MNYEESRLFTFETWPQNAPVDAVSLAKAGFFATGRFLEAQCNWCQCLISDWKYGDNVHTRHVGARPQCPFLVSNSSCGNIPLHSGEVTDEATSTSSSESQNPDVLHIEANRLATFKNWPNPNISPQSLAKAGFYYLNLSDHVKCAWCKGVIAMWEKNDNAFDEHQRFFPDCPRVQLGPLIEMASDGIRDLGIQKITAPKQPKYSSLDARMRTYAKWPIPNIQSALALAQAGLYYQEINDQVRCFHCNIGLRSWQKEDDPWFEHAKWYPQCEFVQLVKGVNYIKEVQEITRKAAENPTAPSAPTTMNINEAMTTEPVRQALEIGLDAGAVRNATQKELLSTGQPFATVEELVKAVFALHEDVTPDRTRNVSCSRRPDATNECTHMGASQLVATAPQQPANVTTNSSDNSEATTSANAAKAKSTATTVAVPTRDSNTDVTSLEEENRKLKDARLCKVCLDEEVGVVFLPCGHLVSCVQCAPGITLCPMCRQTIKGFVRTFLS